MQYVHVCACISGEYICMNLQLCACFSEYTYCIFDEDACRYMQIRTCVYIYIHIRTFVYIHVF
jgi:hypothetical protein